METLFDAPAAPTTVSAFTGQPVARLARRTDSDESKAAAAAADQPESARMVLRALRILKVASDQQVEDTVRRNGSKLTGQRLRTARNALTECSPPLIARVGTGATEAGRKCATWALTELGKQQANEIAREAHRRAA